MDERRSVGVIVTRILFAATALLWLVVGGMVWTRSLDIGPVAPAVVNLLAAAMFAAAIVMSFLAWRVFRGSRLIDGTAIVIAVINVVLTLTDDVGAYDVAYLMFSIVLLASLLVTCITSRRASLGSHKHGTGSRTA